MDHRRPRKPPTRPLVLIMGSHQDTQMFCALALSGMGFDVVPVRDDDDPCRRARETHPDIIVTDLPSANYEDWQVLRDLRQDPRTRDIPIIAVNGDVQPSVGEPTEGDGLATSFPKFCLPGELASA